MLFLSKKSQDFEIFLRFKEKEAGVQKPGHSSLQCASTPFQLVVDTYPVGCEAPPEGSTLVKLIVDTVKLVAKHHRRGRLY